MRLSDENFFYCVLPNCHTVRSTSLIDYVIKYDEDEQFISPIQQHVKTGNRQSNNDSQQNDDEEENATIASGGDHDYSNSTVSTISMSSSATANTSIKKNINEGKDGEKDQISISASNYAT